MNFTNEEIIIFLLILFLFFHLNENFRNENFEQEYFDEVGDYDPTNLDEENPYKVPYKHDSTIMPTPYSNIPVQQRKLLSIDDNSIMPITSDINKLLNIKLNEKYKVLTSTNQLVIPSNKIIIFKNFRDKYMVYDDKNKEITYNIQQLYISNNSINYNSPFITLKTNNPGYELEISIAKL